MGWKDRFTLTSDAIAEKHLPTVQRLFQEQIAPLGLKALRDDEAVTNALKVIHAMLPLPVRLTWPESRFVEWSLKHRERLLPDQPDQPAAIPSPE